MWGRCGAVMSCGWLEWLRMEERLSLNHHLDEPWDDLMFPSQPGHLTAQGGWIHQLQASSLPMACKGLGVHWIPTWQCALKLGQNMTIWWNSYPLRCLAKVRTGGLSPWGIGKPCTSRDPGATELRRCFLKPSKVFRSSGVLCFSWKSVLITIDAYHPIIKYHPMFECLAPDFSATTKFSAPLHRSASGIVP